MYIRVDDLISMESNKNQAWDGIKIQRSRKTQIHKMHPVFIEFYHFLVEIICSITMPIHVECS